MARPDRRLIEIAAGRPPPGVVVDAALLDSAAEHRMVGLLITLMRSGDATPDSHVLDRLVELDHTMWARSSLLIDTCLAVAEQADRLGISLAFVKGPVFEARWYGRVGERPAIDLDVLVAPWEMSEVPRLVEALQPGHSLQGALPDLIDRGVIQSVDLVYRGMPVDLHLDPLKLELTWARRPEAFWERLGSVDLRQGGEGPTTENVTNLVLAAHELGMELRPGRKVPTMDSAANLVLAANELNKDRFRSLLAYCDVARIAQSSDLDWQRVEQLCEAEGLGASVGATLAEVGRRLDEPRLIEMQAQMGGRRWLWHVVWPQSSRLLGREGHERFRLRQFLLPVISGRVIAALLGWLTRVFPPRRLVDFYYADTDGPYLIRLLWGRAANVVARRRLRRRIGNGQRE